MKILIAPDKFKGCFSAAEAAALMAEGVRQAAGASHEVRLLPIADGGEGTADAVRAALGGEWIDVPAHDARGRAMTGRYAWMAATRTAVIEMSAVAGLVMLAAEERDPLTATTFGVGELMMDARRRGARRIVVGIGGSATNDAGFGMAAALGWTFMPVDAGVRWVVPRDFLKLSALRAPDAIEQWQEVIGACDVNNPLLGPRGASRIYGPQKGATPEGVERLEKNLAHLAELVVAQTGRDERNTPGAGAAGGLGYGLMTFAGARLTSGFGLVSELIGLEAAVAESDLVITGEGCLDGQTLDGKGPAGVAALAKKHGRPVIALAGRVRVEAREAEIFDRCVALAEDDVPTEVALREAEPRLIEAARRAVQA